MSSNLNLAQAQALKASIDTNTDPVFVSYRNQGLTGSMADWYNVPSTTDAWGDAVDATTLFEAINIAKYSALAAGDRDAYNQILNQAQIKGVDYTRQKARNGLVDIWGAADSVSILQATLVKATRGGLAIGGVSKTTNTVTALARCGRTVLGSSA